MRVACAGPSLYPHHQQTSLSEDLYALSLRHREQLARIGEAAKRQGIALRDIPDVPINGALPALDLWSGNDMRDDRPSTAEHRHIPPMRDIPVALASRPEWVGVDLEPAPELDQGAPLEAVKPQPRRPEWVD